jgi:hypothetical protein
MVYIKGRINTFTKFKTPADLQKKVNAYFEDCEKRGAAYTISGLAYWLKTTRHTLIDYEERDGFGEIITDAKAKCERYVEEMLLSGKNPIGAIFNLKNNYKRWKEESSTELKGINSIVALIKSAEQDKLESAQYVEVEQVRPKELSGKDSG